MITLPTIAFIILLVALVAEIIYLIKTPGKADPISPLLMPIACGLLLATTIIRSFAINFFAITNMYESLVFFAAAISVVVVIYRYRNKKDAMPFVIFGGTMLALKGFCVAVLGGLGNGFGAVIAGMLIGILESFGAGFISSAYKDAIALLVLLIVLVIKPSGLFSKSEASRLKDF